MFHINGWGLPFAAALAGATLVLPGRVARSPQPARPHRIGTRHGERRRADGLARRARCAGRRIAGRRHQQPARARRRRIGGAEIARAPLPGAPRRLRAAGMGNDRDHLHRHALQAASRSGRRHPTTLNTHVRAKQGTPAPFSRFGPAALAGLVPWDGATMGELEVRGPTVASEYYNEPGASIA